MEWVFVFVMIFANDIAEIIVPTPEQCWVEVSTEPTVYKWEACEEVILERDIVQ